MGSATGVWLPGQMFGNQQVIQIKPDRRGLATDGKPAVETRPPRVETSGIRFQRKLLRGLEPALGLEPRTC